MTLTEELDKWFSIYIRCRFAEPHTGMVHCYTCTERYHWSQVDCGHWQRRGHWTIRWNEDNARPQCVSCNREFSGQDEIFEEELRAELGDKRVDALLSTRGDFADLTDEGLSEKIAYYKSTVKKLYAYNTVVS